MFLEPSTWSPWSIGSYKFDTPFDTLTGSTSWEPFNPCSCPRQPGPNPGRTRPNADDDATGRLDQLAKDAPGAEGERERERDEMPRYTFAYVYESNEW